MMQNVVEVAKKCIVHAVCMLLMIDPCEVKYMFMIDWSDSTGGNVSATFKQTTYPVLVRKFSYTLLFRKFYIYLEF